MHQQKTLNNLEHRLKSVYDRALERYVEHDDRLRQRSAGDIRESIYYRNVACDVVSLIESEIKGILPGIDSAASWLSGSSGACASGNTLPGSFDETVEQLAELVSVAEKSLAFSYEQSLRGLHDLPDVLALA